MNKQTVKTPMPHQNAETRIRNFDEVALGYTAKEAMVEADRCLNCKHHPCMDGCPVNVRIPEFIQKIKENDLRGAYDVIALSSSLPAVCGRVCPQEKQCELSCVRGLKGEPVAIGRLERFVADEYLSSPDETVICEQNGHRVAVVGSGPAGLSCAGTLAKKGFSVTVFEALHELGGVLVYGIPEFRLPKKIVKNEIDHLKKIGVSFRTNVVIGKTVTVPELFEEGYEAVFIGSGAGLPTFMNIPGENLAGVYSANEFLTRINLMKAYREEAATPLYVGKHTVVVGGGNVAMDAARSARRFGSEVTVVYRRSEDELPARKEEIEHAKEEGIQFCLLTNPVELLGENGFVHQLKAVRMDLGEPDASGRRKPFVVPDSEFTIDTDCVIMALGSTPNPLIKITTPGLSVNARGGIVVEENSGATTLNGVYAGGDAVTGAATVISAMGAGKMAAESIAEYLL